MQLTGLLLLRRAREWLLNYVFREEDARLNHLCAIFIDHNSNQKLFTKEIFLDDTYAR